VEETTMTTLRDLDLEADLPIIQAPMAGCQGLALATAVAGTGAIGSLPCALMDMEALQQELALLAAHPGRLFNVNFFCRMASRPGVVLRRTGRPSRHASPWSGARALRR
jgi:nitronate monooxygenase